MLSFLLLSALALTSAKPTWKELDDYTFEMYVQDFNLEYVQGTSTWSVRKAIFEQELAEIKAHNAKNLSWKAGVNKFTVMTKSEKKAVFGYAKGVRKHHVPEFKQEADVSTFKEVSDLPAAVDWRKEGIVNAVKDQGYCGSCWAFATTSVVESHVAKATGLMFDLSVQQLAMCAPNPQQCGGTGGCYGATYEVAFDYLAKSNGMVQEYQYAYDGYYGQNAACSKTHSVGPKAKIGGYVSLPSNNYTALLNAVATVGPVGVVVDASDWGRYESGIYTGLATNPDINHGVVLVGYGHCDVHNMDYWIVRNSWSPTWGEQGYIRVARSSNDDELCGVDITPQDGVACAGDNEPEKVCGTAGILFSSAYPTGAKLA